MDPVLVLFHHRENLAKLESCAGHDFQHHQSLPVHRYRCARCQGIADAREVRWYELGRAHAAKAGKRGE